MSETTPTLIKRYPGSQPFQREQQRIFFGREQDIENLYRTINLNDLTVLYGDSGLGKSSLLNAGVIPKFTEQGVTALFPRFYGYNKENPANPLENIISQLRQAAKAMPPDGTPGDWEEETVFMSGVQSDPAQQTLWQQVKSVLWRQNKLHALAQAKAAASEETDDENPDKPRASQGKPGYILVFDQFEELFSYPEEDIVEFGRAFGELLDNRMPEGFRKAFYSRIKSEGGSSFAADEMDFMEKSLPLKIVMGIRFDRLGLLKQLAQFYPNILLNQNLFRLLPLNIQQGRQAIVNPARQDGPFTTPKFEYAGETLDAILAYLTEQKENASVDTTQLQIICQYVENKVVRQEGQVIRPEDLGDLRDISKNYYKEVILALPANEQDLAQDMIENRMIFEQDQLRLSLYGKQIKKLYPGISDATLEALVKSHLLRVEERSGELIYEISHDALVAPILAAKKIRDEEAERLKKEAEDIERRRKEAEEAEAERQRLLAEAEQEKQRLIAEAEAEHKRLEETRKAAAAAAERERLLRERTVFRRIAFVVGTLALAALIFAYQAYNQSQIAQAAEDRANQLRMTADSNAQRALIERDSANILREKLRKETIDNLHERGKLLMEQKKFQDALENFEEARQMLSPVQDPNLEHLIQECRSGAQREQRYTDLMRQADQLRDSKQYLLAYDKYQAALALGYDDETPKQSLSFLNSELINQCNNDLRRAEIFLNDGKDKEDACNVLTRYVDPILEKLNIKANDELRLKRNAIHNKACPRQ